ncbi:MAG: glycogen-binding domain-containing protein [Bacteroidia bacterium]
MRISFYNILKWTIPALLLAACVRQIHEPLTYRIEGSKVIFEFTSEDLRAYGKGKNSDLDAFKHRIEMQLKNNDSINFGAASGWAFIQVDTNLYQLVKDLTELEGCLDYGQKMMLHNFFEDEFFESEINSVGYMEYDVEYVNRLNDSQFIFYLPEFKQANQVVLSGNFNNWNTIDNKMTLTDSGWVITQSLSKGRFEYKFIVDGQWTEDPNNRNTVINRHGSFNSVFVVPNYTFTLNEKLDADRMILSGSFVNWNEDLVKMKKVKNQWQANMYLPDNVYEYKYIADGEWFVDPGNPETKLSDGHLNSILELGEKFRFKLEGYADANVVFCTGDFIGWDEQRLQMEKVDGGWVCDYTLPNGNYRYKFIVDGEWITDPNNNFQVENEWDTYNSWLPVGETYMFSLKGFSLAEEVILAGTFNNWNEEECRMVFNNAKGQWEFPVHLPKGKHLYKYIVDGIWMTDPENQYSEGNWEGTYNSVIWVEI